MPSEYDDGEDDIDYALAEEEDEINTISEQLNIPNYDVVDKQLNQKEMTRQKTEGYLTKFVKEAIRKQLQLRGMRGHVTQYNKGKINNAEKHCKVKQADDARVVSKQYVEHYTKKLEMMKGSESEKKEPNASKIGNNHRRNSW